MSADIAKVGQGSPNTASMGVAPPRHSETIVTARLDALQAMRAFAALLVVFDHAILNLIRREVLSDAYAPAAYRAGAAGVYIFFVISGFIMAYSTGHETGWTATRNFLLRRIWRVVPLYWLATFVYATRLTLGGETPSLSELLRSLFFIPYFDSDLIFHPVLGPGWTLNFEMYFYLIFAVALLLPRLLGVGIVIALFAGSIALGQAMGWQDHRSGPYLAFLTDPIIAYFMLGIAVHLVLRLFAISTMPMVGSFAGLLLATTVILLVIAFNFSNWVFPIALLTAAPLIVLFAATAKESLFGPVSSSLNLLGDASYSLYLTHTMLLGPLAAIFAKLGLYQLGAAFFVILTLLACSILGILCHWFVEKPLLEILRPYFRSRRNTRRETS